MMFEGIMSKPLILLTNDDGLCSEGLMALAEGANSLYEVFIVAPDCNRTAAGRSLTLRKPIRAEQIEPNKVAVEGTPVDCVLLALNKILPTPPVLLLSGINCGSNMGDDITYSGTVAAAFEGTLLSIPSMAISLVNNSTQLEYSFAVEFTLELSKKVLDKGLPPKTFLNVNIPHLPKGKIRGVMITRQGRSNYGTIVSHITDPEGGSYYYIGGGNPYGYPEEGTDFKAIKERMVSITPLHIDLTNTTCFQELMDWNLSL